MLNCQKSTKRVRRSGLPMLLKRNRSCRGQVLVEFVLVAMFFFLFVFAIMDFSWMMFNQMGVQDAVREAARYAATGNSIAGSSRASSIQQILTQPTVANNIQSIVISNSGNSGVCNLSSSSTPPYTPPATPNSCAGGPGAVVTITANCAVPLLTNVFGAFFTADKFTFAVSSSFKNEPFPSAQTN